VKLSNRRLNKTKIVKAITDIVDPGDVTLKKKRRYYTKFDYERADQCIQQDYLGPVPRFNEDGFKLSFCVSRSRAARIMNDIGNSGNSFFKKLNNAAGCSGTSLQAKVLIAMKTFAFGVPAHAFIDYFQMSKQLAIKCVEEYSNVVSDLYKDEYLRSPTSSDLQKINNLHSKVHGVEGMLGSLDCMHSRWKNCPKAWQGAFSSGKNSTGPTVVLEALCDYHLWFWHASFGYAGSLNDLNILNLSPFLNTLLDGSFTKLEEQSQVVPFIIADEEFSSMFVLVDGIYPTYSRFVQGLSQPHEPDQINYTAWQEGARKDIEQAFGVLQGCCKIMICPFQAHFLKNIGKMFDVHL